MSAAALDPSSSSRSVASPPLSSSSSSSPSSPSSSTQSRCVVVSNVAAVLQLDHLEDLFQTIGPVQRLTWHQPSPTAERVCIVEFVHEKHADTALLITDTEIGDRAIRIVKKEQWDAVQQKLTEQTTAPHQPPSAAALPSLSPALHAPASAADASAQVAPSPSLSAGMLGASAGSLATAALTAAQIAQSLSGAPALSGELAVPSGTIYVGNLAPQVTDGILHAYFSQLGPLVGTQLQSDVSGPNRFGFVEFEDPRVAAAALALHGQLLLGRPMKIGKASSGVGRSALVLGVLTQEAVLQRAAAVGSGAPNEKVAHALAKVAAAQAAIANKLGVAVQTPALPIPGIAPSSLPVVAAPSAAPVSSEVKDDSQRRDSGSRRSRSRSGSAERRRKHSPRHRRHRSSSSPSLSHSRSPSRSLSRNRSPSRSRSPSPHHGRRHRSRDRYGRDRHTHRSHHRRSPSPPSSAEKKDGAVTEVGADRWRAEDTGDDPMERKSRSPARSRSRSRSRERSRRSRSQSRSRSSSRERRRYRDRGSPVGRRYDDRWRRGRHGRSDDEDDLPRRGRRYLRRGGGADPHAGMIFDGFQWTSRNASAPTGQ